ncbi:nucleotidyltransferase domain-containing protein [Marinobacter sp. R17]|uniref:nucleotidyltransferase domain-containing protein n=1 Tax=Marinobacter sp. R17 TaxID=2484250 RepID=UPI001CC20821|nr:nucleotidyltransferase domain-containing protein [Marinobacter sp. R17]
MAKSEAYGIPVQAWGRLKAAFGKYSAVHAATLYGSRAKGNYRHNSDIDLMLTAPTLSWSEFNQLEQDIDDLLLPWKIDLTLRHQVENPDLLEHVDRVGITIYDA